MTKAAVGRPTHSTGCKNAARTPKHTGEGTTDSRVALGTLGCHGWFKASVAEKLRERRSMTSANRLPHQCSTQRAPLGLTSDNGEEWGGRLFGANSLLPRNLSRVAEALHARSTPRPRARFTAWHHRGRTASWPSGPKRSSDSLSSSPSESQVGGNASAGFRQTGSRSCCHAALYFPQRCSAPARVLYKRGRCRQRSKCRDKRVDRKPLSQPLKEPYGAAAAGTEVPADFSPGLWVGGPH